MKTVTVAELVCKVVGPVEPVGMSEVDETRFANLAQLCELVDELVDKIVDAAAEANRDSREHSVSKIGKRAYAYLGELRDGLEAYAGGNDGE